jgi:hypothetical protein
MCSHSNIHNTTYNGWKRVPPASKLINESEKQMITSVSVYCLFYGCNQMNHTFEEKLVTVSYK